MERSLVTGSCRLGILTTNINGIVTQHTKVVDLVGEISGTHCNIVDCLIKLIAVMSLMRSCDS